MAPAIWIRRLSSLRGKLSLNCCSLWSQPQLKPNRAPEHNTSLRMMSSSANKKWGSFVRQTMFDSCHTYRYIIGLLAFACNSFLHTDVQVNHSSVLGIPLWISIFITRICTRTVVEPTGTRYSKIPGVMSGFVAVTGKWILWTPGFPHDDVVISISADVRTSIHTYRLLFMHSQYRFLICRCNQTMICIHNTGS